jgi:hypothetical protein
LFVQFLSAQVVFRSAQDSTAYLDSLRKELDWLFDSLATPKSYVDISVGVSNGYFLQKTSNNVGATTGAAYYNLSTSYYHKSGLGISANALAIGATPGLNVFQTSISPSFDYIKAKNWNYGISYTRYFNKQDLSFYVSPLVNEWYTYTTYKGGFLRTTIALDYATGSEQQLSQSTRAVRVRNNRGGFDTVRITQTFQTNTSISDFSVFLSTQHRFVLGHLFSDEDRFSITPSLFSVAGTQRYGTNMQSSAVAFGPRYANNQLLGTQNSVTRSAFRVQNISLSIRAEYLYKKWYIQPSFLVDYTLPSASRQWNVIANLTTGLTF